MPTAKTLTARKVEKVYAGTVPWVRSAKIPLSLCQQVRLSIQWARLRKRQTGSRRRFWLRFAKTEYQLVRSICTPFNTETQFHLISHTNLASFCENQTFSPYL
jgi:hypothetical protein